MQTIFPQTNYKYYSMAVIENYDRPCFFTQLKPIEISPDNYNTRNCTYGFYITFMQKTIDEAEMLKVVEKLQELFGLNVVIGNRSINVNEFEYDFAGSDRDVLQVTLTLQWKNQISHNKSTEEIMETAKLNLKMED